MLNNHFNTFKNLHYNSQPLELINVWDAASAAIVEKNGATAIATSSASLAWANGYPDGEKLPKKILFSAINNILRVIDLPLSIDIESGYSDSTEEVAQLVAELNQLGVVGINIEDGHKPPEMLINKIKAIRSKVSNQNLFINARTDVYLQGLVSQNHQLDETVTRAKGYLNCGADGIFVPGLNDQKDILHIASSIKAPLNIMVFEQPKNAQDMKINGAQRISCGPHSFISIYNALLNHNTANQLNYDWLNQLFRT